MPNLTEELYLNITGNMWNQHDTSGPSSVDCFVRFLSRRTAPRVSTVRACMCVRGLGGGYLCKRERENVRICASPCTIESHPLSPLFPFPTYSLIILSSILIYLSLICRYAALVASFTPAVLFLGATPGTENVRAFT
jgi:hypothetical protein